MADKMARDYYEVAHDAYLGAADIAGLAETRLRQEPEEWAREVVAMLTGKEPADAA